jgi:hypothetical protein
MTRRFVGIVALLVLMATAGCARPKEPPGGEYRKVSELVRFPDFYPGLGTLYVQPKTLPVGPFRAYARDERLVSTIYMVPIRELEARTTINLIEGTQRRVDHVDMHYTSGHPGVEEPHYHIILWHISPERAASVQ